MKIMENDGKCLGFLEVFPHFPTTGRIPREASAPPSTGTAGSAPALTAAETPAVVTTARRQPMGDFMEFHEGIYMDLLSIGLRDIELTNNMR